MKVYFTWPHLPPRATCHQAAYSLSEVSNEISIQLFPSLKVAAMPRTSQPTMTIPLGALIHCIVECAGLFCSLKSFVLPTHLRGAAGLLGRGFYNRLPHVSCSLARYCIRRIYMRMYLVQLLVLFWEVLSSNLNCSLYKVKNRNSLFAEAITTSRSVQSLIFGPYAQSLGYKRCR